MTRRAFTIGYQGVAFTELVARLQGAGVTAVVDTRASPSSRRPEFRHEALRGLLESNGIRYVGSSRLGVPKRIRPLARRRPWLFAAAYRGIVSRASDVLEELAELARSETIALLCYEIDPAECHRSLLAEALAGLGGLAFTDLEGRAGSEHR